MDIDIFRVLDYIRDHSSKYASAKANRVYLDEFRKSKKALLMRQAGIEGVVSAVQQETHAYSHPEYLELLEGIKSAVEEEERLKWMLIAAQAKAEAWRTLSANSRIEARTV